MAFTAKVKAEAEKEAVELAAAEEAEAARAAFTAKVEAEAGREATEMAAGRDCPTVHTARGSCVVASSRPASRPPHVDAMLPFAEVARPPHIENTTWYEFRPDIVAYNAHMRVHAVALLVDRNWHDQVCEQAAAASLWFYYLGQVCDHWHAVIQGGANEQVVLQMREVMRVLEDSWKNLEHMGDGRRKPASVAFGSTWSANNLATQRSAHPVKVPRESGLEFSHPSPLLGYMWRTTLYANAIASADDKAVRETFIDATRSAHLGRE